MHVTPTLPVQATDFYAVYYQEQPALLRGVLLRSISAPEFTEICEMMLALAQHLNCRYWLVDGRTNCPPHRFGIHNWLEEEYLPRVRDVLGRPLCLAYLVPTHWQQLPGSKYIVSTEGTPTATYRLALFDQEAAALTWLEHCRAR